MAKKTALINQIQHLTAKIDRKEINELINLFHEKMDSPTNDGLNNFLISHSAKQNNTKVMVSGVGGDEFFFGYPSFNRIPLINNIVNLIPKMKISNYFFNSFLVNIFNQKN